MNSIYTKYIYINILNKLRGRRSRCFCWTEAKEWNQINCMLNYKEFSLIWIR